MRNNLLFGVVLITFGFLFLLDNLGMADFGEVMHDFWPLLIIVWGLSIILRRKPTHSTAKGLSGSPTPQASAEAGTTAGPGAAGTEKELFSESTVFGNLHSVISSHSFKGGSVSTVFGDCHIDLTRAAVADGEHFFRVHGVFGQTTIMLPNNCAVSVTASSMFGGLTILGQQKNGIATELTMSSPNYGSSSNRLKLHVTRVFGEIRIG